MPPRAEKGAKTVPGSSSTARRTGGGDSSLRGGSSSRGGRGESNEVESQRIANFRYTAYVISPIHKLR